MKKIKIFSKITLVGLLFLTVFSGCEEVADISIDPIVNQTDFTFSPEIGYAGSVVVISGTNLGNVEKVAFGTAEASIISASDTEIRTAVPVKAITDKLYLIFADQVYTSLTSFTVSSVPVPVIASFSPVEVSRGENVTITGTLLDQVKRVYVGGNQCVIVSQSETEIVITTPESFLTASLSVIYDYTTTYGLVKEASSVSSAELGLLLPAISSVVPGLAGVNIGDVLTINGTSLNLVNTIQFGDIVIDSENFTLSDGVITVAVPEGATTGTLTLSATDGDYDYETSFSVNLPLISSFTPQKGSQIMDSTRPFSVLGSNFNLVDSVMVGSEKAEIVSKLDNQLLFTVSGATSGTIKLYCANGVVSSAAPFAFVGNFWVRDWDTEFDVARFDKLANNGVTTYVEATATETSGNIYGELSLSGDLNGKSVYLWGKDASNDKFLLYVSNPDGVYYEFDMKVSSIDENSKQEDGSFKFKIFMMDALGWGASGEYTYGYNGPTSYVRTDGEWQHFRMPLSDFVASGNGGLYTAEQVDGTAGAFCHPNSLRIATFVFGVPSEDGKGDVILGLDNIKFAIE